jgi:gas vesicle protein
MDKSTGKALVGFIVGAAVGVAAGILFAPQKGTDTRKELKKKADEIGKEVSEKVGVKMDEMKKYVEEIANDAKTKFKKVEDA